MRLYALLPVLTLCQCVTPPRDGLKSVRFAPAPEPEAPAEPAVAPQGLSELPGRWVPSPEVFTDLGAGRIGTVTAGRRIVIVGRQVTLLDAEPVLDLGRPHRIPVALGGGWLYRSEERLYYADQFDTALRAIGGSLDGETLIGVGHGIVSLHGPPSAPSFHHLPRGDGAAAPVPGAVELFGAPSGMVVARTGHGDVHLQRGRDARFEKLPIAGVEHLAYDGKGIVLHTARDSKRIAADGRVGPLPVEPGLTVSNNLDAFMSPWPDMSRLPARSDADRLLDPLVVLLDDSTALTVEGRRLVLLNASTGAEKPERPDALGGRVNCFAIRGGTPAFVGCNGSGGGAPEMALMRIDSEVAAPVLERTFKGVYTHDFGDPEPDAPLAIARRCDGRQERGALCVRRADGRWNDLPKPADPGNLLARAPFIVHVAAAADGSAYAFAWLDGGGDLIVNDSRAGKVRRIDRSQLPEWGKRGIRWDSLQIRQGTLRFLISGDEPGILEIRPDDQIVTTPLSGRMAAAGQRALLITPDGKLRETLDGGGSFHDVLPPPGGAPDDGFFLCLATGCSLGVWHRIGWGPD
jgi:hypothetical protein